MKKVLVFLSAIILVASCVEKSVNKKEDNKNVNLSGRLYNFNPSIKDPYLRIYVYNLGRAERDEIPCSINEDGTFDININVDLPQDISILYNAGFHVIVHPGDSIYVEFDAEETDQNQFLSGVKFSGSSSEVNTDLSIYMNGFFETLPSGHKMRRSTWDMTFEEYVFFQDSVRNELRNQIDVFIEKEKPSEELINWTFHNVEMEYYSNILGHYCLRKKGGYKFGKQNSENEVDIINYLKDVPKIDRKSLINTKTSARFVNKYMSYISSNIYRSNNNAVDEKKMDSLMVDEIMNQTQTKSLLRELVLAQYFNVYIKMFDLSGYEKFEELLDQEVTTPFLSEPLKEHYLDAKNNIEEPHFDKNAKLSQAKFTGKKGLYESIVEKSKGKVTYIDCWGAWCSSCLVEFPYSKRLMERYKNEDIEFVYLCFFSKPENWKATVAKYELGGKHYFLNEAQSKTIQKQLKIRGYPHYILLDRNGEVVCQDDRIEMGPGSNKIYDIIDNALATQTDNSMGENRSK